MEDNTIELTYNNGTAYFSIESPDFISANKSADKMISEDVISFSITEELGKLISGSLQLRDESGIYSKMFRNGRRFSITFGYKSWNQNLANIGINSKTSRGIRQGIRCQVETPSGSGNETGETIYNVTFIGMEFLVGKLNKVYESGTRYDVVSQAMKDAGISQVMIDFEDANTRVTTKDSIMQRESPINFLHDLAKRFKAFFTIYNKPDGTSVGVFINTKKVKSPQLKGIVASTLKITDEKNLYYNCGQLSNVKSFDWQQHIGESGQGDGVSMQLVEGKMVYTHYVADSSGTVKLYKLNEEKVRKATKSGADIKKSVEILGAKQFSDVKQYFDPCDSPLAPQGAGFTINVKMHGDPMIFVLLKVYFKGGFPAPLTQTIDIGGKLQYYVKRVTHTFNKSEFSTDVEIVDTYNLNGSNIPPVSITESLGS